MDREFVKLMKQVESSTVATSFISRTNALMRKSEEQQGEHKKLEKSLNVLEEKRKRFSFFFNFALIC